MLVGALLQTCNFHTIATGIRPSLSSCGFVHMEVPGVTCLREGAEGKELAGEAKENILGRSLCLPARGNLMSTDSSHVLILTGVTCRGTKPVTWAS